MTALTGHLPGTADGSLAERRTTTRVAAGIAISLAIHALLLASYRQPRPLAAPAPAPAKERLTVRLQAAPERPPQTAAEPPLPAPAPAAAKARPAPRPAAPRRLIAVPARPAPPPRQQPFQVEPQRAETAPADKAPADPAPAPRFDLDAARGMARRVANEPDPARAGTALERLPPPPLQTESKLERGIKGAKRRDCKDGVPGGLLAPILLALDKKDSGCKW